MAGRRILVVEDEPLVLKIEEERLSADGFVVLSARDGRTALAVAKAERPDLILLDLMLPGLDGFGVLERLKADPDLARIPVLVVSSVFSPETQRRAMALGAASCLPKTYMGTQLFDEIRRLLPPPKSA